MNASLSTLARSSTLGSLAVVATLLAAAGAASAQPTTINLPNYTIVIDEVSDWNDYQVNIHGIYTGTDGNDLDLTSIHFRNLPGDVMDRWEYEDFQMPNHWSCTTVAPGMINYQIDPAYEGLGPARKVLDWSFDTDYSWAQLKASGTQVQFDYRRGGLSDWYDIPAPGPAALALAGLGLITHPRRRP